MFNIFSNKSSNNKKLNYIKNEITTLDKYFKGAKYLTSKHNIRDKSIFFRLKYIAIKTDLGIIKHVQKMLQDEEIEDVYLAIDYIKDKKELELNKKETVDLELYKALLYELVDDNHRAKESYLKAIKSDETKESFNEYKEYQIRVNELKDYSKYEPIVLNKFGVDDLLGFDSIENSANSMEAIAKYYIRSPKSTPIAQNYYKRVISTYKDLASKDPKKYKFKYVLVLIKSVELFKMDISNLEEAEVIIFHSNECKKTEKYLLNKIKMLKDNSLSQKVK